MWTAFKTVLQLVAGWVDVVWEWVENTIQDMTPEQAEEFIEWTIAKIWESGIVQEAAQSYAWFRERNPEAARNIEAAFNIGQVLPITKAWQVVKKPLTKAAQEAKRETAKQTLKDTGRFFLNLPTKTKPQEALDISKFFADKVKPTQSFDNMVTQFDDIWRTSIKNLDDSLAQVTKTFKPQWAKEVLNVIKDNLEKGIKNKSMPFSKAQLNNIKWLLKKFETEWLTLTELNKIKRSINDYTKVWTSAWREATWVAPEAMRWKYREVMQFIENTARKEWIPNVKELNQDWIKSNTLTELLNKQAGTVWKKKWAEVLQPGWVISWLWEKVFEARRKFWLTDLTRKRWLETMDFEKAIQTLKKLSKQSEKKWVIEKIQDIWKKILKK